MPRKLTSATSLEQLKRDAKRWLRDINANDSDAIERFRKLLPSVVDQPTLRDVQHAIAREFELPGWAALKAMLASSRQMEEDLTTLVDRFLDNACPDHHVRGRNDHIRAEHTAMRLLHRFPQIAKAGFHTAIVTGDIDIVASMLAKDPALATRRASPENVKRGGSGGQNDLYGDLGPKGWEPLNYLCFTRLPLESVMDNSVNIARLLLDHGADPNTYFMAGDSRYTPLVGAIGHGEEERPSHQCRNDLVNLLLERGANPFDIQVVYNLNFEGDALWFLKTVHAHTTGSELATKWDDPEWSMMDMGGYGSGARWFLERAVNSEDRELLTWCLEHGANPDTAPKRDKRFPNISVWEVAKRRGLDDMAELLEKHGAAVVDIPPVPEDEFLAACMRLDRAYVERVIAENPAALTATKPIFEAIKRKRADVVTMLLDLGVSPDVESPQKERPLHWAGYYNAVDAARVLIDRGAEIDPVESNWNNTPLGAATYSRSMEMIDLLVPLSKDIWELVYGGHIERLRVIFATESERARIESNGHTPLMWLPTFDEALAIDIARLLMQHGAAATARNNRGETAEMRARALGMYDLAARLTT